MAGKTASEMSVKMDTAEKKKLIVLLSSVLHSPSVSPQNAVTGWQMLPMATMKMMAAHTCIATSPHSGHRKRRRESAMRTRQMQMLLLMGTVQAA